MLPEVYKLQETLKKHEDSPASYEGGQGYWDDFCLAAFLEGVCNRYIAFEVSLLLIYLRALLWNC